MCASKRFGKFAVLFLFLLSCLGSSIPVSAEAEEEPEVLTAIASADVFFSGFLIAEGDTLELEESQYYLEDAVSYLIAYNENGGEALLLAEISGWETVDIQTAGSYTVTVHLCIDNSDRDAANYVLAPELENISIPVCISQPEAFDLFCARTTAESHVIYCLPELHEGDSVYAYSSEQPCDDAELDDCTWTLCDNEMASICQNGFFIHRNRLPEKWYTYFYVQTEDTRSQYIGIFEDGSQTKVISMGGDRDGSDNVASPTPAVSQPAPAAPEAAPTETRSAASTTTQTQAAQIKAPAAVPAAAEENDNAGSLREEHKKKAYSVNRTPAETATAQTTAASATSETSTAQSKTTAAAPMLEYSDSDRDTISGYRLQCMFEQSGNAVFSKNGVTLSIPQGAFPYTDADTVTVSITPKEDGNYAVQVTVNDENVSLQKEVTLWFPESLFSKDAEPALEVNGAAQLLEYDADSHAYRMDTSYLGIFSIPAAEAEHNAPYWIFWLAGGIAAAGLGIYLFLRLRNQKR